MPPCYLNGMTAPPPNVPDRIEQAIARIAAAASARSAEHRALADRHDLLRTRVAAIVSDIDLLLEVEADAARDAVRDGAD